MPITAIATKITIGEYTVEPATASFQGKTSPVIRAANAKGDKVFLFEPTCSKETVQTFLEMDPKDRGDATQFGDWKNSPFIRATVPEKEREKIDGGYPVEEK